MREYDRERLFVDSCALGFLALRRDFALLHGGRSAREAVRPRSRAGEAGRLARRVLVSTGGARVARALARLGLELARVAQRVVKDADGARRSRRAAAALLLAREALCGAKRALRARLRHCAALWAEVSGLEDREQRRRSRPWLQMRCLGRS